jgi:hypothetical protein
MARFCTRCGETLEPDDRFCAECGAPVRVKATSGTSVQERRVFGSDPQPVQHGEQWLRVFGDDGPGTDVPAVETRRSSAGVVSIAVGVATPLAALILHSVGIAVLFLGGLVGAAVGGVAFYRDEGLAERVPRDQAAAGLTLGLFWVLAASIVLLVRGA